MTTHISVDADSLRRILLALNGPGHYIRELQATRGPLFSNPIDKLAAQYDQWAVSRNHDLAATTATADTPIDLEGLTDRLLAPREIVRDACGWLTHPAMPICDEGVRYDKFLCAFGMEAHFCAMDGDAPQDDVERYFDQETGDCSSWTPTPPEGDGWVLLEIYDTEDGPHAVFARRELETKGTQ